MSYNPFSLEGKTILVTGASSGIGRATAIECSRLGAKVVITGRNAERLQDTLDQLEGDGHMQIIADLDNEQDIENLVADLPVIDGLVNNAGIAHTKPFSFIRKDDLESVFATNTFAPILLTRAILKKKKMAKKSSIVFISSMAALNGFAPANSVYGASKAAIMLFSEYAALELADKGIRVNSVHPGMVDTPLIHNTTISEEEVMADMVHYPLKRYGRPEEIAWSVIYLLSDASAWVTGTQSVIDGGVHLK